MVIKPCKKLAHQHSTFALEIEKTRMFNYQNRTNMNNSIATINNIENLKPVGINYSTGLNIYQSFQAQSGFNYQVGVREMQGLIIVEEIVEGTACLFLSGIQVREKETGKEICNISVERNTRYSRQLVMELVHQHLCNAIIDSVTKEGGTVNRHEVEAQVAEMLDHCYFAESRQAALGWAKRVGIIQ